MIYKFKVTETRVKYLEIETEFDDRDDAIAQADAYVSSGEFDMDRNIDDYSLNIEHVDNTSKG